MEELIMTVKFTEEDLIVKGRKRQQHRQDRCQRKLRRHYRSHHFESATSQMVADFYEVDKTRIEKLTLRNRSELDSDGLKRATKREILKWTSCPSRKFLLMLTLRQHYKMAQQLHSNRGVLLYPRRAILRVGMLLRDSNVAREVRTSS